MSHLKSTFSTLLYWHRVLPQYILPLWKRRCSVECGLLSFFARLQTAKISPHCWIPLTLLFNTSTFDPRAVWVRASCLVTLSLQFLFTLPAVILSCLVRTPNMLVSAAAAAQILAQALLLRCMCRPNPMWLYRYPNNMIVLAQHNSQWVQSTS